VTSVVACFFTASPHASSRRHRRPFRRSRYRVDVSGPAIRFPAYAGRRRSTHSSGQKRDLARIKHPEPVSLDRFDGLAGRRCCSRTGRRPLDVDQPGDIGRVRRMKGVSRFRSGQTLNAPANRLWTYAPPRTRHEAVPGEEEVVVNQNGPWFTSRRCPRIRGDRRGSRRRASLCHPIQPQSRQESWILLFLITTSIAPCSLIARVHLR